MGTFAKSKYSKMSVADLERLVRHHNYLYFVERRPEISDFEFDELVLALRKRKPDSLLLSEIGSDLTEGAPKIRHEISMLSLDKAYDLKTMNNWASKFSGEVVASPKIDGCAVSIKYGRDGKLYQAVTRGNGIEGELITKNVMEIKDIPKKIGLSSVEVRGEVYMSLSIFKGYSGEFANPRNLTAGAIKQKDPKKTGDYNLSFWGYDLLGSKASTEAEKLKLLSQNGFPTVEWKLIQTDEIQKSFAYFLAKRDTFDFETDGVVYKANRVDEQTRLGSTAHHPRHAIAYKFQGDSGETRLIDVEWNVARTGVITPVAVVEPVELSGAMVSRASLHNYGMMLKLKLTKGAKVLMMRRGGVIPNLERVVQPGKGEFGVPRVCPSCGAPVELKEDFLYCTNRKGCMRTKIAELEHFVKIIECDGFGMKLITKLYENRLMSDPADFYRLSKDDLLGLERMGDVLAEKLVRNIDAKRELPLDIFLQSLGIRELGRHVAGILSEKYGNLNKIRSLTREEMASIHTIGDVIATYVVKGLKERGPLIDKLIEKVRILSVSRRAKGGLLIGKKFLFTGALLSMERRAAQKLVEENGGIVATSISKEVDYLVVGGGGGAGSKLDRARRLKADGAPIQIIGEDEFLRMVGRK